MKNLGRKQYLIIAGVFLFFLLSLNLLFWGSRKEGYFCDELYSYHFTHQVQHPYMVEEKDGITWLNNWHSSEFFQDYLTLTEEETFDVSGVWQAVEADVHPPLFYLLLELSSSVFSTVFPGIFTKWSGILVNIVFFLFTILFLWKLARELTDSDFWSFAVCVLYGFSAGAASMVVFIRMYTVFTCFAVLFMYLNVLLWKGLWGEKERNWLYLALSITTIAGILIQYYFLIYAFPVCVVIWGYALLKRNYRFAGKYTCTMAAGLVGSCLIWPDILNDIFSGYRGEEAFANLTAGNRLSETLSELWKIINGELFGNGFLLLFVFAVVLLLGHFLSIWWCLEKYTAEDKSIHILFRPRNPRKKPELRFTMQDFVWAHILFAAFFYVIFMAKIAPYREDRYIFPVFPLFVLLVVTLIKKLVSGMPRHITNIAVAVMVVCMLAGLFSPGVNYLYRGTEDKLERVSMHSDLPVIYITSGSSYRACGDSVYLSMAKYTYPVLSKELDRLPEALAGFSDADIARCLFYIDLYYEDRTSIEQEMRHLFPAGTIQWLFDTEYSAVYIVE